MQAKKRWWQLQCDVRRRGRQNYIFELVHRDLFQSYSWISLSSRRIMKGAQKNKETLPLDKGAANLRISRTKLYLFYRKSLAHPYSWMGIKKSNACKNKKILTLRLHERTILSHSQNFPSLYTNLPSFPSFTWKAMQTTPAHSAQRRTAQNDFSPLLAMPRHPKPSTSNFHSTVATYSKDWGQEKTVAERQEEKK